METRTEQESQSSAQDLFVTVEGIPAYRSCDNINGWEMDALQQNGNCYGSLMRRNTELLKAVKELEHTCVTLREENTLLRKSNSPETEEKVKRLKRKNAELANIARRLEERARKLQEANLRVVNSPVPATGSSLEHYKKVFARQRANYLSEHADVILAKDQEIEGLRQECRDLHAKLGPSKEAPDQLKQNDFERVLRESQKEVLRLQRQLAVVSLQGSSHMRGQGSPTTEISSVRPGLSLQETTEFSKNSEATELCKKRKECESHEQEIKKRQRICQDLENELKQVWSENARLTEETIRLSQEAQETDKTKAQNNDLRGRLSAVTAERDSVLKENQRLQAKLENLEQVLKHMREVAERRHQLQLEHEEALTILQAKQHEVERLQQAQFEAKKEHEGVVQLLENTLDCMQAKVRDLEEKCRSQSTQFSLLSQELEHFRLQAGNIDLLTNTLVNSDTPGILTRNQCQLLNGVESPVEKGSYGLAPQDPSEHQCSTLDAENISQPVSQSSCPTQDEQKEEEKIPNESQDQADSVSQKSEEVATEVGSVSSKVQPESNQSSSRESPKTELSQSTPKSCTTPDVDTASEVEELDIDHVSSIQEPEIRITEKLKVFIARYSYNPFDGPNENPEAELPLTAGEYIYVYGDMDEDGFYEGELMDGRRGLVPSNFIERVSDEDMLTFHPPEANDLSQSSFQEISFHSSSEQSLSLVKNSIDKSEICSPHEDLTLSDSQIKPESHVSNGFDLNTEDVAEYNEDVVPYPRKLKLIKQLAKSIIVSWEPPLIPGGWGTIFSYNIYVDNELRMNVKFGAQTKAVIERLDLNTKTYRIYVQCVTDKGNSDEMCSSVLVGKDVCVAPMHLKVQCITTTSADISWLPSNSNYSHVIFLNEEEYLVVKAGCYACSLTNLRPNMKYKLKVEARPHQTPWELPPDRRQLKCVCAQFATLAGGPPDAPLDVQIEAGPTPGVLLISWLPVTIDAAGTSNGVRVTGYAVFADGEKIIEVTSPTAGSVLVRSSQIQVLQISKEISVRTLSPYGESPDSSPIKIPRALFTFPLQPVSLQTGPEKCLHPNNSIPLNNELPNADFKDDTLPGITCDNIDSATSCNGNEQGNHPPPFTTFIKIADIKQNFEESACVQDEDSKMVPNLKDGAAGLLDCCQENKLEEQPKEVTNHPEHAQLKRQVGFIEEFLVDMEQKENHNIEGDSEGKHLENDLMGQLKARAIEAPINRILESKGKLEYDAPLGNVRVPSIEEFLTDSELKQENIGIGEDEEMIEEGQLGSEKDHQDTDEAESHENEDYPPESSRGSDLSDIMEEDEEELGSDSRAHDELQNQECSLTRENSLKGFAVDTDSCHHRAPNSPGIRALNPNYSALRLSRGELFTSKASYAESCRGQESSILDGYKEVESKGAVDGVLVRIFVALFDYDPATMSPNPDAAEEELAFKEGQILKVYGDKDADGFYRGEANGQTGFVPCNMVSEIQVDDDDVMEQLLKRDYLAPSISMEKLVHSDTWKEARQRGQQSLLSYFLSIEWNRPSSALQNLPMKRMMAVFDYDPRESSPNVDIEAELTFSAGDIITVYGDMDEDGFYYGDLNGIHGLAPSNFLELISTEERVDTGAGNAISKFPQTPVHKEKQLSLDEAEVSNPNVPMNMHPTVKAGYLDNHACNENSNSKKKKGFFSKGKKLFKRLGSSKRE
ncbi:RIMS-binding protein 2-like isoform X12 [Narcine bancroftii]|uniref:RIMS-binding protein 2-like isoform X12 n=1 Tax=Narcine bancroftii TaxID=1343680 RepID=UPI003831183D